MTKVQFNIVNFEGEVGSSINVFGHPCIVEESGVFGDIDDEFVASYIECGRIFSLATPAVAETPVAPVEVVAETPVAPVEVVAETPVAPVEVVAETPVAPVEVVTETPTDVIENGTGKRNGRPAKAQ